MCWNYDIRESKNDGGKSMKLIRLSNLIINFFLVILVVVSIIGAIVVLPTIIGRSSKLIVLISIVLIMLIAFIGTYWGKSVYLAKNRN